MSSTGLEIRHHRPRWQTGLMLVISGVIIVSVAYFHGYQLGGDDNVDLKQQLQDQQRVESDLQQQLAQSKSQLALLTQGRKVDEVAIQSVMESLKSQQQEALELREEIAFYRGIVAPSESKTGILIQRFELDSLPETHLYQYRLVLTQVLKNERVARGSIEVTISGALNGQAHSISLHELSNEIKKPLNFRFKYFQMFEGNLLLPDGFTPQAVGVRVKPRRSKSSITGSFPWPVVNAKSDI